MQLHICKKNIILCLFLNILLIFPMIFIKDITNNYLIYEILIILLMNFILLSKIKLNLTYFIFILCPLICFLEVEVLNNNLFYTYPIRITLLNLILYSIFLLVIYIISNRATFSIIFTSIFFYIISIANYFVLSFRGRAIFPNDITAITTALNVSNEYNYKIDNNIYFITVILFVWIIINIKYKIEDHERKYHLKNKLTLSLISIAIIILIFATSFLSKLNINIVQWYGNSTNGFLLNFTLEVKNNSIQKPKNYSEDTLKKVNKDIYSSPSSESDIKPNIIAIMNESFSDLQVLGDLETNQDYMPFINSLSDNTIKGYALASVHGGGTANSEFEFLTGNSMAFLPREAISYQNYINTQTDSLVSIVKAQGYTPIAVHPYLKTSWNRSSVYENLGFNQFLTINDISDQEYFGPYIGDSCNYKNLIKLYENKKSDEKLFIFNVTMQNHSPYSTEFRDDYTIYLTGKCENKFPQANEYLSRIYESDRAFEELINYFSNVDEPTIILMFGDHQPNLGDSFDEAILNKSLEELSLEELQKKYTVPFIIWANYDIPEKNIECTSLNYLSNYLLDCTSLKKSAYFNFLSNLEKEVPAINAFGYKSNTNNSYTPITNSFNNESNIDLLEKYKILEYNMLFDKKNKLKGIFNVELSEDS